MADKQIISTPAAPAAIGPYSQAVRVAETVYLSGQIALDPVSMTLVEGGIEAQSRQVLNNLAAVAHAAGGSLDNCVKLTIFLTDLNNFGVVNGIMQEYFNAPYPARATVQVSALPRQAIVEIDAVLHLPAN